MCNFNDAKDFIERSKGIIMSAEFKEKNIDKYCINKLIEEGLIERYQKGVYVRSDVFEDPYYILQKSNPSIMFSYNTALYFLNKTEKTPETIDITVYKGYNAHRFSNRVQVHYIKKENLKLGAICIQTPFGFEVTSYDCERTMCDFIRSNKTGIDKEQSNKFIREMFSEKQVDTIKLIKYAKALRCESKVRAIMEVFI